MAFLVCADGFLQNHIEHLGDDASTFGHRGQEQSLRPWERLGLQLRALSHPERGR